MFKEIKTLRNFAAYKDFAWPNVADMRAFSKFNLFYGWNYSGKTTISRFFDCLRAGRLDEPFLGATFHVTRENGTSVNERTIQPDSTIRVFNVDYVRRNLRWDQPHDGLEPVFILGEENLALQARLEEISVLLSPLRAATTSAEERRRELERSLNQKLTDESRKIKQQLWADRTEAFERPQLQKAIEEIGPGHVSTQLTDEQYAEQSAKFSARFLDKLLAVNPPTQVLTLPKISSQLLSMTPSGGVIEKLQENPELNLWAKSGWQLHAHSAGEQCAFCGNLLSVERVDQLEQHFSQEYKEQLDKLIVIKESYVTARNAVVNASSLLFNRGNFYAHLAERATESISEYQTAVTAERNKLDAAISLLAEKEKNLFVRLRCEIESSDNNRLLQSIERLNAIVREHNDYGTRLAESRESARLTLTRHAASQAAAAMEFFDTRSKIDALKNEQNRTVQETQRLETEQRSLRATLDQSAKGAERINDYLDIYFGKADQRIVPNDKNRFEVKRGGQIAVHLSEGEKTAISFAHFLATIEERGALVEETIVFIDDPVSSLDANHLFGVFSLIESHLQNCKQLFVSTHNHEFFDLMLDWRKNSSGNIKQDSSAYLVRKLTDGAESKCDLVPLPAELIKFRSEYVYLFSLIYRCEQNPVQGGELLTLPNAMRRFLEAFLRFKYLGLDEAERWNKCFGKAAERVRKYLHVGSHENAMRATKIPDRQEAIEISKLVMAMLKSVDEDHFNGLVSKVQI
ncbi:MAG: hypothetical protein A2W18_08850 [Candidatus Muproteobacteria bacterium RBG_16_60_9]|uniref:Protein CR006 P-loop domain-containing protein n=1 Tax=Candidatus Muproteobacteria bacterium RBG_16_60_9 TaxID=1817755 RepID=A0A1F6VCH9_9PROT|nr:MAG: hypothetical protein A2W18_08850 [Candidatus Muproteobacteria bacterium RBG_16_60_9]